MVIGKGRRDTEKSVVLVENGTYRGFGFIDSEFDQNLKTDDLKNAVRVYPDNRDIQQILRSYLKQNGSSQIITF